MEIIRYSQLSTPLYFGGVETQRAKIGIIVSGQDNYSQRVLSPVVREEKVLALTALHFPNPDGQDFAAKITFFLL